MSKWREALLGRVYQRLQGILRGQMRLVYGETSPPPVALLADRTREPSVPPAPLPMRPSGKAVHFLGSLQHTRTHTHTPLYSFCFLAISGAPTTISATSKVRGCGRAWEMPTKPISHPSQNTTGPHFPVSFVPSHRTSSGQWKVGTFHYPGLVHQNLSHLPLFLFPHMLTGHIDPEVASDALRGGGATRRQSPTPRSHWIMT